MASAKSFEDLEIWNRGRKFALELHQLTAKNPINRDFCLRDQLLKAAVSMVSKIAEGFERSGNKEFIHFLYPGKGSAAEIRAQMYLALDLNYISSDQFSNIDSQLKTLSKQINALIRYLEGSDINKRTNSRSGPRTCNL